MQVAMGTPTNLEGIPEEIQRVAREAFMNSDAPLRSISNALGALVEGRIPAVQASTNTNSNTSSNSQSTSAVVPCTHEEEENGDKDNIDDEFWQKEFPDEWSCEEESTESPSSKSESSLDLPTDVIELPMEIDQIETCKIDIEKKWSSRRLDKTVESFVEILYVDVIPEAMQKTLSNLAATFISVSHLLSYQTENFMLILMLC